jgi:hypothetical protein
MIASILSWFFIVLVSPVLLPLAFIIALMYHPSDTVPKEEDLK